MGLAHCLAVKEQDIVHQANSRAKIEQRRFSLRRSTCFDHTSELEKEQSETEAGRRDQCGGSRPPEVGSGSCSSHDHGAERKMTVHSAAVAETVLRCESVLYPRASIESVWTG